jgi:hypothetical protein
MKRGGNNITSRQNQRLYTPHQLFYIIFNLLHGLLHGIHHYTRDLILLHPIVYSILDLCLYIEIHNIAHGLLYGLFDGRSHLTSRPA